jgi:hypothetical protein
MFTKVHDSCESCSKSDLIKYLRPKIGKMQINREDSVTLASTRLGTVRDLAKNCDCVLCRLALDIVRLNVSNLPVESLLDMEVVICSQYVVFLNTKDGREKEISQLRFDLLEPKEQRPAVNAAGESQQPDTKAELDEKKPWDMDELKPLLENLQPVVETPFDYCVQLASSEDPAQTEFDSGKSFLAKRVNPHEVDVKMVKHWLAECEENHGTPCNDASWVASRQLPPSFRVLDVHKLRVIPVPEVCRYVALSYVWGYTSMPQPTAVESENGIRDYSAVFESLPRTIRDAILFTRAVGESYLWIDAMCIIQSNENDVEQQIGHMDVIYGLARFTIVAAAGSDADAGLPGVRPGTRSVRQLEEEVQNMRLRSTLAARIPVDHSPWNQRAWTLQERLLSRRCVIFTEHQGYFQCKSRSWSEDTHIHKVGDITMKVVQPYRKFESLRSPLAPTMFQTLTRDIDSPHQTSLRGSTYEELVTEYTSRRLSYASDALNAFCGVEKLLSKRISGPFLLGLPTALFDEALLWQPVLRDVRSFTPRPFPSWSWASWDGRVTYTHLKNIRSLILWLTTSEDGELTYWTSKWLKRGGHPGWGRDAEVLKEGTDALVKDFHNLVPRASPGERICFQSPNDVSPESPQLLEITGITTMAHLRIVPCGLPARISADSGWILCGIFNGEKQLMRWTDRTVLVGTDEPATIALPAAWVEANEENLCEFILIALECRSFIQEAHIMLVERHGRSMRRVGLTNVHHYQWMECRPQHTLAIII